MDVFNHHYHHHHLNHQQFYNVSEAFFLLLLCTLVSIHLLYNSEKNWKTKSTFFKQKKTCFLIAFLISFQTKPIHLKMPYYYPNEILYPDYNAQVQPSDFGSYQIYNYEKPVENTDFYLCKYPFNGSVKFSFNLYFPFLFRFFINGFFTCAGK